MWDANRKNMKNACRQYVFTDPLCASQAVFRSAWGLKWTRVFAGSPAAETPVKAPGAGAGVGAGNAAKT